MGFLESVVCRGEWELIWVRLRHSGMGPLVMDGWMMVHRQGEGLVLF